MTKCKHCRGSIHLDEALGAWVCLMCARAEYIPDFEVVENVRLNVLDCIASDIDWDGFGEYQQSEGWT